ncbi:uncharacterized protein LOC124358736 isoform X1 [Homalodisca vitripennis]|uniref:uncharacterized protein LOC124358736 isoform X1 n=1 Tax=Homalodisca vitripennis TaxID=197043 RepID=UPI001EEB0C8E|nr:uncharacterized protein LOC124358736 isoform X1 [Homalodisca vitripennis]
MYGPPPTSPLYQGDCSETPDPNPYFPKPAVRWRPQPQFWYQGDPCPPNSTWPVGDPDDYKFETLPQPQSEKTLLEEMEIERPERYLPGEIYRNERPKRPIEDLSKTSNCPKVWSPKDPAFYCEFRPTREMMNPPLLLDDVIRRKAETFNSYIIPQKVKIEQSCEGVEDAETKKIKTKDYLEALKYADTRPADFKCEVDERVPYEDACKIPDPTVKVPPAIYRKIWRPSNDDDLTPKIEKDGSNTIVEPDEIK